LLVRHLGALVMSVAVLSGFACRAEPRPEGELGADSAGGANVKPASGHYSLPEFARLRWLEGSWRGRLPDGGYFYERYHALDDSTIVMHGFTDSTFARTTDSSRITLRGGTVASEGGSRWEAISLDSSSVDFVSTRAASNGFIWTRESPDKWKATLRSEDKQKRPVTTIYQMERVGR
jgi:hypothetical protein